MTTSQNGYDVISASETYKWVIPFKKGPARHLILKPGDVGFVLACFALWYHERIEPLNVGVWDEWGWADRPIRGSSVISNHASGTAMDLNATKHPLGVRGTLKFLLTFNKDKKEIAQERIRRVLSEQYDDVIRAGVFYTGRPDEMHYEIVRPYSAVYQLCKKLRKTKRGRRVMAANPSYRPGIER